MRNHVTLYGYQIFRSGVHLSNSGTYQQWNGALTKIPSYPWLFLRPIAWWISTSTVYTTRLTLLFNFLTYTPKKAHILLGRHLFQNKCLKWRTDEKRYVASQYFISQAPQLPVHTVAITGYRPSSLFKRYKFNFRSVYLSGLFHPDRLYQNQPS